MGDDGADAAPADAGPVTDSLRQGGADQSPIDQLRTVMATLRDPHRGCAWDIAQSFSTIAPFTIEEAYEVADAIEREDLDDLREELGDLLLQVIFHARMAEEAGAFDFDDVATAIVAKMVRRHPHVFGDTVFESDAERQAAWESAKASERTARRSKRKGEPEPAGSALDGIARNLPALSRADKVQRRAARVGFDWPELAPVRAKIDEELAEVAEAAATDDKDALEDELGDFLFSAVNLVRHYNVDPEKALSRATGKFAQRFRQVEALALADNASLDELDITALDALWEQAKRELGQRR